MKTDKMFLRQNSEDVKLAPASFVPRRRAWGRCVQRVPSALDEGHDLAHSEGTKTRNVDPPLGPK